MNAINKRVLIYGLGVTGVASVKALCSMGFSVSITDGKAKAKLESVFEELASYETTWVDETEVDFSTLDFLLKSPGIPPSNPLIQRAEAEGIEVISDLELCYRLWPDRKYIAITGTNGKTTVTSLIGHILETNRIPHVVSGNIGFGVLWDAYQADDKSVLVVECSSFQLAHSPTFRPDVALMINISPDHLDWHGSMEAYIEAKVTVAANQKKGDVLILNDDDPILRAVGKRSQGDVSWISQIEPHFPGAYCDGSTFYDVHDGTITPYMAVSDSPLLGGHNRYNLLFGLAFGVIMGLSKEQVISSLCSFRAVEHRLEYVATIDGVSYYNDSKGTNVDATVKALEAMAGPTVVIAGGYDKKVPFDAFFEAYKTQGKGLVLMGETREQLYDLAIAHGIESVYKVDALEEAVNVAKGLATEGDTVLLSPASASWGMFINFEERGTLFKRYVYELKERE